jgi:vancomycin permeability regulator SanA
VTDPSVTDRGARIRVPRFRSRRSWRRLYQALVIATLLVFTPITAVRAYAAGYEKSAADVPYRPVAVVFGAGAPGGTPTPFLARRLDVAIDLYRRGKVAVILVTGDNSRPDYDEPTTMRDYLVAHGIPAARVVRDFAGFDTWESCVRARKIFGVTSATLVTQDFHLPRALTLCRAAGIDAVGVADTAYVHYGTSEAVHDRAREIAAGFKALIQAAVQPSPRFLGPQEHGVADALTAAGRHG